VFTGQGRFEGAGIDPLRHLDPADDAQLGGATGDGGRRQGRREAHPGGRVRR
jgi:hypothetical protein